MLCDGIAVRDTGLHGTGMRRVLTSLQEPSGWAWPAERGDESLLLLATPRGQSACSWKVECGHDGVSTEGGTQACACSYGTEQPIGMAATSALGAALRHAATLRVSARGLSGLPLCRMVVGRQWLGELLNPVWAGAQHPCPLAPAV